MKSLPWEDAHQSFAEIIDPLMTRQCSACLNLRRPPVDIPSRLRESPRTCRSRLQPYQIRTQPLLPSPQISTTRKSQSRARMWVYCTYNSSERDAATPVAVIYAYSHTYIYVVYRSCNRFSRVLYIHLVVWLYGSWGGHTARFLSTSRGVQPLRRFHTIE